ncbi:MAG: hypothetical protein ACYC9Z_18110 [Casimicrobiaceae bacterium]
MGLTAALALVIQSFLLFCVAMLVGGACAAIALTFRFAATECMGAEERPMALSIVLAGGTFQRYDRPRVLPPAVALRLYHEARERRIG